MKLLLIFVLTVLSLLSTSILNAASISGDIEAAVNDSTIADNGSEIESVVSVDRMSSVSLASVHEVGLQRSLLMPSKVHELRRFRSGRCDGCIYCAVPSAFFLTLLVLMTWLIIAAS